MVAWLILGAAFGAVGAWGTFAGVYEALTATRGVPARRLPRTFWRPSITIALLGAVLGAALMWKVVARDRVADEQAARAQSD